MSTNHSSTEKEGVGCTGLYYTKICDKHYGIFRETNIIKELILCMLHYVKLVSLFVELIFAIVQCVMQLMLRI